MDKTEQTQELIETKERRLHKLKLRKASEGIKVDPAVTNEIEDIESELKTLRIKLKTLEEEQNIVLAEIVRGLQLEDNEDDIELLDFDDGLEITRAELLKVMKYIETETFEITEQTSEFTQSLLEANSIENKEQKSKVVNRAINLFAKHLSNFGFWLKCNNPIFIKELVSTIRLLDKYIAIVDEIKIEKQRLTDDLLGMYRVRLEMEGYQHNLEGVCSSIKNMPISTTNITQAKRLVIDTLAIFMKEQEKFIEGLQRIENEIKKRVYNS